MESRPISQSQKHITEDVLLRARDEGAHGQSEEEDDVGVRRGVGEEGTAEEKVHEGDTGRTIDILELLAWRS